MEQTAVLSTLIGERSRNTPDQLFLLDADGPTRLTYAETQRQVERWAGVYRAIGVEGGGTVLTMLPASAQAVCSWLGLACLRAIEVPINTGYRGALLEHIVEDSLARLIVISEAFLPELAAIVDRLSVIAAVVVTDVTGPLPSLPFAVYEAAHLLAEAEGAVAVGLEEPTGRDISCILYTSGTTGRPKGVEVPWAQLHAAAEGQLQAAGAGSADGRELGVDDTYYSPFPMFHVGGRLHPYVMALVGGAVVVKDSFRTQDFWREIRMHGCTVTFLLSSMIHFVVSMPVHQEDAVCPLRTVLMVPVFHDLEGFRRRFGVEVGTLFNMTELSCPIVSDGTDLVDNRSCGRVRAGYHVRVVDENDEEIPTGHVGELVVRADSPWVQMSGYWRAPEATRKTWRNLWFHTGDAFTCDNEGNFYFVERMNDLIRRRGENISSAEIEAECIAQPDVAAAAAVGVPSRWGDHEIKLVVVPVEDSCPSPESIVEHLARRLPKFMVPRYIEIVDELPMTPTQKVQKASLREAGITPTTFDACPDRLPIGQDTIG